MACKNSYDDNGYFWLTYESKISETTSWTFTYATKEEYDFNYYYDNSEFDFGIIRQKKLLTFIKPKGYKRSIRIPQGCKCCFCW